MIKINFIEKIPPVFRNKYVLTLVIFFLWLLLFDSNNLISRFRDIRDLKKLRSDREYYLKRIEEDKKKLYELKTDDQNLEKFAREQYRMKRPDEDLFIVLTPRQNREVNRRNN